MGDCQLKVRIRDGCRGGHEQFKWNSLKEQEFKDREQYLGATTKVGMMGKFGRYHVHDWYQKKRDTVESIDQERAQVQSYEDELMQEALGLKPKKLMLQKRQLTPEELKEYLSNEKPEGKQGRTPMGPQGHVATNEFGETIRADDFIAEAHRAASSKGLGFAHHRTGTKGAKLEEYKASVLGTTAELGGSKNPGLIKIEDDDDIIIKLGLGLEKKEPGDSFGSEAKVKLEVKKEVKEDDEEGDAKSSPSKRRREEEAEGSDERKRRKLDKKEKKARKHQKKLKKQEKQIKKAARKAKKSAKKAEKRKRHNSSVSSSSSSSSS